MAKTARAKWYAKFGVGAADARRLERALCTLADFESPIKLAMAEKGARDWGLHDVCDGIRHIIDDVPEES
jgi:hypothetical protein